MLRLVAAQKARLTILALASLGSGLAEAALLVTVTQTGLAITRRESSVEIVGHTSISTNAAIGLATLLVLGRATLALVHVWVTTQMGFHVGRSLKNRLARAFLGASWATQQAEPAGRLQHLVGGFAGNAIGVLNAFTNATSAALSLLALLGVSLAVNVMATLGAIGALLVLGSVLAPLRKAIRRRSRAAAEVGIEAAARITELGALGLEMQTYGVRDEFIQRTGEVIQHETESNRRADLFRSLVGPTYMTLGYLALIGALAGAANAGGADIAEVGAVMLVMLRSLSYGQALQVSLANVTAAAPFLELVDETLERFESDEAQTGPELVKRVDDIVAEHVSFSYDADTPVLRDVAFQIAHGEHVGVVGPSGGGKSTLVQLLLGLRPPTSGRLLFGGVDVAQLDRRSLAPLVAFVPQDPQLFRGTIADNIVFFRPNIDRPAIEKAAQRARLDPDLARLPHGLDTDVGERGTHLSGGQRQRVSIARALLGDPQLMILDEPTSALDVHSEVAIRDTLAELRGDVTVIVIAHRLSTLDACDRVMVLQDGEVLAFAPPAELASRSDFYRSALALANVK